MSATIRKLKYCPYGNAYVKVYDDGTTVLTSYATEVCYLKDGYLFVTGLYSRTTIRHISYFMREFTSKDYYFAKSIAFKNFAMHTINGDIMEIDDFFKFIQ